MLPNLVLLGAQKSATTFLLGRLAEHPEVHMVRDEVLCFEDPDYATFDPADLERLFESATTESTLGIKRADYLARPEVAPRIFRHLPEARLIAVLRDPVARAISAYFYYVRLGLLPLLPLEEGMRRLLSGVAPAGYSRADDILEYGRYHTQLTRYLELFPRERLLVLTLEDLNRDVLATMRNVYEFLEVDPEYVPRQLTKNSNRGVYSLSRLRILTSRNRFMYRYAPAHARVTRQRLDPLGLLWVGGVTVLDRVLLRRLLGSGTPACPAWLRQRLVQEYEEEVRGLESLLGRDLSSWLSGE